MTAWMWRIWESGLRAELGDYYATLLAEPLVPLYM